MIVCSDHGSVLVSIYANVHQHDIVTSLLIDTAMALAEGRNTAVIDKIGRRERESIEVTNR